MNIKNKLLVVHRLFRLRTFLGTLLAFALAGLTMCQLAPTRQFWAQLCCWKDRRRETKASFTVLSTTNLSLPLANWTVVGTASTVAGGLWQFTDMRSTNQQCYYAVISP